MEMHTIKIKGLRDGDLTRVAIILAAANVRGVEGEVGIPNVLNENRPNVVIVHTEDVPKAVMLIHILGFDTEERSQLEELQKRVIDLERGIKVSIHEFTEKGREWGWAQDPEFHREIKRLQDLLK